MTAGVEALRERASMREATWAVHREEMLGKVKHRISVHCRSVETDRKGLPKDESRRQAVLALHRERRRLEQQDSPPEHWHVERLEGVPEVVEQPRDRRDKVARLRERGWGVKAAEILADWKPGPFDGPPALVTVTVGEIPVDLREAIAGPQLANATDQTVTFNPQAKVEAGFDDDDVDDVVEEYDPPEVRS